MAEIDFNPSSSGESAFPRPTSLFQPERYTPSLLDSSSYSPFPSVSGTRSDPFGLNAYLLHPGDQIWAYLSPAPSSTEFDVNDEGSKQPLRSLDLPPPKSKMGGLKKVKSSAILRKGSPLSQSSVPSVIPVPVPERPVVRRRSQSVDSTHSATLAVGRDAAMTEQKTAVAAAATVGSKKGFGRLFGRRKSISSLRPVEISTTAPSPPVSKPAPVSPDFTPSSSSSDLSTPPQSNRSSLMISDHGSTTSSRSSVYALQTPVASPSQSTDSLTDAVTKAEAGEDGSLRRRGLMGWLGRRALKIPSSDPSPSSAESSPTVSPNTSSTNLVQSPSSTTPIDPPSRISPTPEQIPYAWVGDQLRRASYRKLAQLRRPSPHPLAQQLRRQTSHLPNEVASSFEVGTIMYPRSINSRDLSDGLTPAQQGLFCLLGVKLILDQLDRGNLPSGAMGKRPSLPHTNSERKPKGMRDFINRPPFEDRYLVFYPDDIWSPVSMARPGFGVWDLDFSKYILALADSGDVDARASWPKLPRPSFLGGLDGLRSGEVAVVEPDQEADTDAEAEQVVVEISEEEVMLPALPSHKAASIGSSLSDDSSTTDTASTMVNTPLGLDITNTIPEIKIDFDDAEFKPMVIPAFEEGSGSSFRRTKVVQQTWEESDDEDEEEEEEDVQPLRMSGRGVTSQPQGMKVSTSAPNVRDTIQTHSRRISQPIPLTQPHQASASSKSQIRRSQFDMAGGTDEDRQSRAMAEVVRARERRQALQSGEVDRRADGELRRKEEAKRRSNIPAPVAPLRPQSTGGAAHTNRASVQFPATQDDRRQRTQSFGQSNSSTPLDQTRASIGKTKRYHSFYEVPTLPSSSSSPPTAAYTRGASHPSPQQFTSPSLPHHPGMVHSASMGFMPSHIGFYPQPMQHGHQPMYFPTPPPAQYYNPTMQSPMAMGMAYGLGNPIVSPQAAHQAMITNSRSTLSLAQPDQQRRQRQRSSYA